MFEECSLLTGWSLLVGVFVSGFTAVAMKLKLSLAMLAVADPLPVVVSFAKLY